MFKYAIAEYVAHFAKKSICYIFFHISWRFHADMWKYVKICVSLHTLIVNFKLMYIFCNAFVCFLVAAVAAVSIIIAIFAGGVA